MNPRRIVITGGPGTGKTAVVDLLEQLGYLCFHEIIRSMTMEAKKEGSSKKQLTNPLAFVSDPYEFNKQILEGRIKQFQQALNQDQQIIFYDRGIPDVLAYMDYFKQKYGQDFEKAGREYRYDAVLLLPPWKEIYISDNERLETFEEALEIHSFLEETYKRFDYEPIIIPKGTVKERTMFALEQLKVEK